LYFAPVSRYVRGNYFADAERWVRRGLRGPLRQPTFQRHKVKIEKALEQMAIAKIPSALAAT
jgi:hypothetical protein